MVAAGKLLPRAEDDPVEPLGLTTPEPMSETLSNEGLIRTIQNLRYEGKLPTLQYDILDARRLLEEVHQHLGHQHITAARLAKCLRSLDMVPLGLHSVAGVQCMLWTCLRGVLLESIVAVVRQRAADNATELHMELNPCPVIPAPARQPLLSETERDVLSIRIRPQGLRYPRPREIAHRLGLDIYTVNTTLQAIRRKLGFASWRDMAQVRKAIRETGALMDYPAFC